MGYALRSIPGYLADRSHKYWLFVFFGYGVNMLAVPALALAGNWPVAAAFIILERTGRAIRRPAVETMISHAGKSIGRGWVFGLNEALDQTGATVGPLVIAFILYLRGSYQSGFAVLLISALLCLSVLAFARIQYPRPEELEAKSAEPLRVKGFSKTYWIYFFAGALIAAGFADFALIAFHFQKGAAVPQSMIPVLYSSIPSPTLESGDVYARTKLRALEIRSSIQFIFEQLDNLPAEKPWSSPGVLAKNAFAIALVEGHRGEIAHVIFTDVDGKISQAKIKDPSFHNWHRLALALRENGISDFPLCNKSFDLSYAGHDL